MLSSPSFINKAAANVVRLDTGFLKAPLSVLQFNHACKLSRLVHLRPGAGREGALTEMTSDISQLTQVWHHLKQTVQTVILY